MPYKVRKINDDNRKNTCGWFLPNGFYHVVEMTFENFAALANISSKDNYSVEYVTGETGFFMDDGTKVEESSVYDMIVRKTEGARIKVLGSAKHEGDELESLREECRRLGIRFHPASGARVLKQKLDEAKEPKQASLAVPTA